jgi:hypothetical protein
MWQGLVRDHLLAGRCRVGFCAEYRGECDAQSDTKGDSDGYVLRGRSQYGSETQTQTDANANAYVFDVHELLNPRAPQFPRVGIAYSGTNCGNTS